MASFMINLSVAIIWLFLAARPSLAVFVVGWILGFVLLMLFRNIFHSEDYIRRSFGFFKFFFIFSREFIYSNLVIAWAALARRRRDIHPDFLEYDVSDLSPMETFLLAQSITLTPGTTAVDLVGGDRTLIIHAFDADHPEAIHEHIDRTLRSAILEFTR